MLISFLGVLFPLTYFKGVPFPSTY